MQRGEKMNRRNCFVAWLVSGAAGALALALAAGAFAQGRQGAAPGKQAAGPPDPPSWYAGGKESRATTSQASLAGIAKGKPGGIEVGQYAPDFQLEPIEAYTDFAKWLGDKAPKSAEQKVMLSDFTGKAPIILLFGSYT